MRSSLLALFAAALLPLVCAAQTPPPPEPAPPKAEVPTFANASCPIMGKKVSLPLFVDTELGRIYLCCKPCIKKVLADVATAHKTAYPKVEAVANTVCPVSGEAIGDLAVEVTLQGLRFKVCCSGCVAAARTHSQVTLAKLTQPTRTDVGNRTCPITGAAVTPNNFTIVDGAIVHLATPEAADEAAKDPAGTLAKARALAKAQPPKEKHTHEQPPAPAKPKEAGK